MALENRSAAPGADLRGQRHITIGATLGIRLLPGVFDDRQHIVAARRTRPTACDTLSRFCARHVLCWFAFLPVPALRSTNSATGCPALFAGFVATTAESDFSGSCIIGFDSSSSRCGPTGILPLAKPEISRFPHKERPHMPGSPTTPGWARARVDAPVHFAFRDSDHVGTRNYLAFAAPWLAYALPYRRFADTLASANARLGADADR